MCDYIKESNKLEYETLKKVLFKNWEDLPIDEKIKRRESELECVKKRMKFLEEDIKTLKGIGP